MPERNYLQIFNKIYPNLPPIAMWRAIEARLLNDLEYRLPMLDLGCGDGQFSKALFSGRFKEIDSGCDLNEIEVLRARKIGFYRDIAAADATRLPYGNEEFVTVFSNCVLEHIPDEHLVIKEVARILRRGGRFIFTVPSEKFLENLYYFQRFKSKNLDDKANDYVKKINDQLGHLHYHDPHEWKEILGDQGLELEFYQYYLTPQAEKFWDRATSVLTKKIAGYRLMIWIGQPNTLRGRSLGSVFNLIFYKIFGKMMDDFYRADVVDDDGGGLLLVAGKR